MGPRLVDALIRKIEKPHRWSQRFRRGEILFLVVVYHFWWSVRRAGTELREAFWSRHAPIYQLMAGLTDPYWSFTNKILYEWTVHWTGPRGHEWRWHASRECTWWINPAMQSSMDVTCSETWDEMCFATIRLTVRITSATVLISMRTYGFCSK